MKRDKRIAQISDPVRQYLRMGLRAEDLVRIVDDLVANDFLHGLDSGVVALIDSLHEFLALYIRDEPTRKQEPGIYVGDLELRRRAAEFEHAIEQLEGLEKYESGEISP